MLTLLFITTNILFDLTSSSDFCAFGHARSPVGSNIGNTHNWINGEFNRDTSYESTGQSELFLGRAYYKMIMQSKCFVPVVYLFRYINAHVHPPINTWVIAGGMGTSPEESYAFCTAASDLQDTPDGSCDGQWIFKKDSTTFEDTVDGEFLIMPGGCPQVTCQTLYMRSLGEMDWMQDYDSNSGLWSGTFIYSGTPDIYKQTNNDKSQNKIDGGTYYLFWNHKTWMWAINAYIDKYLECDSYKIQTFQLVSNVIGGTYTDSMPIDGANFRFDTADAGTATRKIYCEGTIVTPNPTAQAPQIPSLAPAKNDWCKVDTSSGVAPSVQDYIDTYCNTPAPIVKQIFPNDPTSTPSAAPTDPTSTPSAAPTDPTSTPSAAPTDPTLPPVDPAPRPSQPPNTLAPTIAECPEGCVRYYPDGCFQCLCGQDGKYDITTCTNENGCTGTILSAYCDLCDTDTEECNAGDDVERDEDNLCEFKECKDPQGNGNSVYYICVMGNVIGVFMLMILKMV